MITSSFQVTSFIPLFFVAYLVIAMVWIKYVLLLVPLVLYLAAALISALVALGRSGRLFAVLLLFIYPLMHIVNGVGLLWGLINGKPEPAQDGSICIRRLKGFGEQFS